MPAELLDSLRRRVGHGGRDFYGGVLRLGFGPCKNERERAWGESQRRGKTAGLLGELGGARGEKRRLQKLLGGVHGARLATELLRVLGRKKTRGGGWAGPATGEWASPVGAR